MLETPNTPSPSSESTELPLSWSTEASPDSLDGGLIRDKSSVEIRSSTFRFGLTWRGLAMRKSSPLRKLLSEDRFSLEASTTKSSDGIESGSTAGGGRMTFPARLLSFPSSLRIELESVTESG
jgi:hypothetical protein